MDIVYQDWRTEWFPPMVQAMLAQFHAAHPDIRVFYVPDPENAVFEAEMLADFSAGTIADVFQGCCTHFPVWAQKGYALDLRPFVADLDQATIDDWDRAQYRAFFLPDGRQYGLPKYHGALALYYNKDLFDERGVDYPTGGWTYDDYLAAMQRLVHDDQDGERDMWGSMVDIAWDKVQVHVNAWGGRFVDPADATQCRMSSPEALAAVEWLRARIWDDRVMPSVGAIGSPGTREAFVAGRLAMAEEGSWALRDILADAPFRIGVAPMPAGPARKVTLATTDGFGIYAGTRHPEAAWELLKFLISKDYGLAMARADFLQPARASLVDEWADFIREAYPEKTREVDLAAFADGHRNGYSVVAEVFSDMAAASRIAAQAWDEILVRGQAPVQRLEDACRQIQAAQPPGD